MSKYQENGRKELRVKDKNIDITEIFNNIFTDKVLLRCQ